MALAAPHLNKIIIGNFGAPPESPQVGFATLVKNHDDQRWWLYLLKFVDAADIEINEHGDVRLTADAYDLLRDMIVNRPTELGVFLPMIRDALGRFQREQRALTRRQEEAIKAAEEAAAKGLHPARYVADILDIGAESARQLLKRAHERQSQLKMLVLGTKSHIESRGKYIQPREAVIRRKMASYRLDCPGKEWHDECEGATTADRGLCWPCFNRYGFPGERPPWLDYLVKDNWKEMRRRAIDEMTTVQVGDDEGFDALLAA